TVRAARDRHAQVASGPRDDRSRREALVGAVRASAALRVRWRRRVRVREPEDGPAVRPPPLRRGPAAGAYSGRRRRLPEGVPRLPPLVEHERRRCGHEPGGADEPSRPLVLLDDPPLHRPGWRAVPRGRRPTRAEAVGRPRYQDADPPARKQTGEAQSRLIKLA